MLHNWSRYGLLFQINSRNTLGRPYRNMDQDISPAFQWSKINFSEKFFHRQFVLDLHSTAVPKFSPALLLLKMRQCWLMSTLYPQIKHFLQWHISNTSFDTRRIAMLTILGSCVYDVTIIKEKCVCIFSGTRRRYYYCYYYLGPSARSRCETRAGKTHALTYSRQIKARKSKINK